MDFFACCMKDPCILFESVSPSIKVWHASCRIVSDLSLLKTKWDKRFFLLLIGLFFIYAGERFSQQTPPAAWKKGKKQGKHKRQRPMESSDSNGSYPNLPPRPRRPGPLPQSWPASEVTHASPTNMTFPPPVMIPIQPAYSMPGFQMPPMTTTVAGDPTPSMATESMPQSNMSYNMQTFPGFPSPYMGTLMTVFLPNYNMYPSMNPQIPQPVFPSQYPCPPTYPYTGMPSTPQNVPHQIPTDFVDPTSRASSPMSAEGQQEVSEDPHLFSNSRSSSPLQLVLLQEELPKPTEPQEGANTEKTLDIKCVSYALSVIMSFGCLFENK